MTWVTIIALSAFTLVLLKELWRRQKKRRLCLRGKHSWICVSTTHDIVGRAAYGLWQCDICRKLTQGKRLPLGTRAEDPLAPHEG
tara:strand:- start:555 stop:809 length:255 start_codon:yes stop_codon:yes gene_type:complete